MAQISKLARVLNGLVQNVDLSSNELALDSVTLGGVSGTNLTKTILDSLIANSHAAQSDNQNITAGSGLTGGGSGATVTLDVNVDGSTLEINTDAVRIKDGGVTEAKLNSGVDAQTFDATHTAVNYTPAQVGSEGTAKISAHLKGIDAALASVSGNSEFTDNVFRVKDNTDPTKKIALEASAIATSTTRTLSMPNADVDLGALANSNIASGAGIVETKLTLDYSTSSLNTAIGGKVAKSGDTMSGNLAMGGNKVTGLAAPTANGDALRYDQLGANSGIATLDAGGKVPVSQLPNSVMEFKGVFDPASATFTDAAGNAGDVWLASAAGSYDAGSGSITYAIGDWAVHNGTIFQKSLNSNAVVSVNGQTGVVSLNSSNISENTNLYFTDERAQDAVGAALLDTTTVDFTYNDTSNTIEAFVKNNSIDENHIKTSVAGAGLAGGNGTALSVSTGDGIEISADAVKVKATDIVGDGIEEDGSNNLRVKLDGSSLARSASGMKVNDSPAIKISMVAGEAFAANTSFLIRMAVNGETAGRIYKATNATASTDGKFWAIGALMSTSALSAGDSVSVTLYGSHTLGASDTAFNAADIGKPVWITTSGAFSVTAPTSSDTAAFKIGMVATTSSIMLESKQLTGIN